MTIPPTASGVPNKIRIDYPPACFTPEDFLAHAGANGVGRAVLVEMSFYGFDNSYMIDSIGAHPGVFSGIGIVNSDGLHPDRDMQSLANQGVRGFRIVSGAAPQAWLDSPGCRDVALRGGVSPAPVRPGES